MQPGSEPEDIQTILSRFHTWTGKNPGNGNGKTVAPEPGAVREIPYEEAMRNFRQRQNARSRRGAASAARLPAAAPPAPTEPAPAKAEDALPAAVAACPLPDANLVESPTNAKAEPAALARRAAASLAEPVRPSSQNKVIRKKPRTPAKKASAKPASLAVLPLEAKRTRVQPKAPIQSKPEPRRATGTNKSAAPSVRPRTARAKEPAFKKVLARTVRSRIQSAPTGRKPAPATDRNQRITTRFSAAEQRRLERAAAEAGLTVSAWLRQCALHAQAASVQALPPPAPRKKARAAELSRPDQAALFSTPAASGLGNWITLLRQRFLSSSARFSERA